MINFSYNSDKNQLDVVYSGTVTLEEILDYIKHIKNGESLPKVLKIYTIAKNSEMAFNPEDLPKIVEAVEESIKNYNFMADAFVVDKARETAFSLLFSSISVRENYKFKVFSTEQAAEQWLKNL